MFNFSLDDLNKIFRYTKHSALFLEKKSENFHIKDYNKEFTKISNLDFNSFLGKPVTLLCKNFNIDFDLLKNSEEALTFKVNNKLIEFSLVHFDDLHSVLLMKDISEKIANNSISRALNEVNNTIIKSTNMNEMLHSVLNEMLSIFDCHRAWLLYPCDSKAKKYSVPLMQTTKDFFIPEGYSLPIDEYSAKIFNMASQTNRALKFYSTKSPKLPEEIIKNNHVKSQILIRISTQIDKDWVLGIHDCKIERNWSKVEVTLFEEISKRLTDGLNSFLYKEKEKEADNNLKIILNSIGDAVIAVNKKGNITHMNPVAEELTGWKLKNAQKTSFSRIFPIYDNKTDQKLQSPIDHVLKNKEKIELSNNTYLLNKKNKKIQISDSAAPIIDSKGQFKGVVLVFRDVSEKYIIKENLKKSKRKFETIFNSVTEAILIQDPKDGKILDANSAAIKLYKYPDKSSMLGEYLNSGTADADSKTQAKGLKLISKAMKGETQKFDWHAKRYDNTKFWAQVIISKVKIADKAYLLALVQNIDSVKKAKDALKKSEKKYRTLFEKSTDPILLIQDGVFVNCNKATLDILDYKNKNKIINKNPWEISPVFQNDGSKSKEKAAKMINLAKEKGYHRFEWIHLDADNKPKWFDVSLTYLIINNKPSFYTIWRDITQKKEALRYLKQSEEKFRSLAESTSTAIMLYQNDKWVYANPAAEKLSGYSKEELKEMFYYDLIAEEDLNIAKKIADNRQKNIDSHLEGYELKIVTKNKTKKIVYINGTTVIYKDQPAGLISAVDITEKITALKQLQKMHKLESIGTLAGGIAHDFNNILTGIYGNISLIKHFTNKDNKTYKYLQKTEESLDRAKRLTNQLLTFSKGGSPIKEHLELKDLIKEIVHFDLSGSNIHAVYNFDKNLYSIKADKGQINQVISNIVINARQAMPDGGNIFINMKNIDLKKDNHLELKPGKYISIGIKDQGIGIKKENMQKIFDPYFTTKKSGNGLGMATVYSIIKRHGGIINISSKVGRGTKITILLPATSQKTSILKVKKIRDSEISPYSNKSVLIMDDETNIKALLKDILSEFNIEVALSSNGEQALTAYKSSIKKKSPFDLIIVDLTVPEGMGGKETIKHLHKIDPLAKVVVTSGYSNDPVLANFKDYGFIDYLRKPFTVADIKDLLGKIFK